MVAQETLLEVAQVLDRRVLVLQDPLHAPLRDGDQDDDGADREEGEDVEDRDAAQGPRGYRTAAFAPVRSVVLKTPGFPGTYCFLS